MINNMLEKIDDGNFTDDDLNLTLVSFEQVGDNLLLTFELSYEGFYGEETEVLQKWLVTCENFDNHNLKQLESFYYRDFEIVNDHVLLWDYHKDFYELYFHGQVKNIKEGIGELYLVHRNITEDLIPFGTYMNTKMEWLIEGGLGLFAEGPEPIIREYEKVLAGFGVKTSLLPVRSRKKGDSTCNEYKVLLFGNSYVVAKRFETIQIS